MGSSSSKLYQLSADIQQLKNQLQELKDLDKNNDGVITKDEFRSWKDEQKTKMIDLERRVEEQVANKYNKMLIEKQTEIAEANHKIAELTKQLEAMKNINTGLESKLTTTQQHNLQLAGGKIQELSKQRIDEFVEKLLNDKNVNIGYLPDFVERQIYKNVFNLIVGLLDNTLSSTSVKLLGHELTFNITPEVKENKEVNNKIEEDEKIDNI
ncbi:EF-hand domain-containing protein [Fadolivirus algeromassiliense]|jgi:hypothetical protein|uniref:EF-hand domain-containing protein n=1 Tax=Fadolivirus FV1/VV64 TaxID=3070911 RepID=A0A7D3QUN0_9VIRU|nr:EF-hand domain-containing protein [Fadolivirus algeromassiliense]QKF94287.1 EF-hand domain-containing protein [Fadolivirus FV1/VV64]